MPVSYSKKVQLNTLNATQILVFAGGKATVQFLKKCGISNALNGAEDNVQLERKGKFRVNDKCVYSTTDFRGFYDERKLCTALSIC